ncbi:MAG: RusA family crossover junction endodeoxyribonuclease [Firmicutes bacterium]|nr:RusA family crossover junction endodeoxyribonuclease [Bacillota bacterium]
MAGVAGGRLVLPLPPTGNTSHRVVRAGARLAVVTTPQARAFREEAGWRARAWRGRTGWRPPEAGAPVALWFWVFWPDRRRRDVANLIPELLNALEGVLYADDRWVLPRAAAMAVDPAAPRVECWLSTDLAAWPPAEEAGGAEQGG